MNQNSRGTRPVQEDVKIRRSLEDTSRSKVVMKDGIEGAVDFARGRVYGVGIWFRGREQPE